MYDFTSHWFLDSKSYWEDLVDEFQPKTALEIGCYEGQSTVFMIENGVEYIDCVDMWNEKAFEDAALGEDPKEVKERFLKNIELANHDETTSVGVHEISSLGFFLKTSRRQDYDLIYIDGSHRAKDVLCDAVLAWNHLSKGGVLIFDDYDWIATDDPTGAQRPALAINSWATVMAPFIKEWESNNPRQKYWIKT